MASETLSITVHSIPLGSVPAAMIHSYIVLQHIPVRIGEPIIAKLIESVREGGIGALHMTILPPTGAWRSAGRNMLKRFKFTRVIANIVFRRRWNALAMEMNLYRTERIVEMLARSGIERITCIRVDDWGSIGLWFLFKRDVGSRSPWSNPVRINSTRQRMTLGRSASNHP
jgi:hypothetical protein